MTATITLDSHRGITVGPQGGTISYNGGNTTQLSSFKVTGSGAITFSNIPGFGGVSGNVCATRLAFPAGANDYQGGTTFFTSGSTSGAAIHSVIFFNANDQVPDNSAVTVTNNDSKGILNLFGKSDTWGSLAGNGNILNGTNTTSNLTVGQNNQSTTYSGSLGKTGVTWSVGAAGTAGADKVDGTTTPTGSTALITLTKVGSGTMTMSGASQYSGATNINGGTLLVTGSLSATPVTVGNGTLTGALGGSGSISGAVTVSSTGHLSPAVSPSGTSTLTIGNNLTINAGATLDFNFGEWKLVRRHDGELVGRRHRFHHGRECDFRRLRLRAAERDRGRGRRVAELDRLRQCRRELHDRRRGDHRHGGFGHHEKSGGNGDAERERDDADHHDQFGDPDHRQRRDFCLDLEGGCERRHARGERHGKHATAQREKWRTDERRRRGCAR